MVNYLSGKLYEQAIRVSNKKLANVLIFTQICKNLQ